MKATLHFLGSTIGWSLSAVVLFTQSALADFPPLRLGPNDEPVAVIPEAVWLADPERRFTMAQIAAPPLAERFTSESLPAQLVPDSGLWVRFRVEPQAPRDWLLIAGSPALSRVCVYWPRSTGIEELCSGWDLPFSSRPFPDPLHVFPVPGDLATGPAVHLYAESRVPAPFGFSFVRRSSHYLKERSAQWRRGLYYGALGALVIYNLFLFASVRDAAYLFYAGHVGGLGLAFFGFEGLAAEHLWPEWPDLWFAPLVFLALSVTAGNLYVRRFYALRDHLPRLDVLLQIAGWIAVFGAFLAAVRPILASRVIALAAVLFAGGALTATIVRWRQGFRPARFLLFAQALFLTVFPLASLAAAELLPGLPSPMGIVQLSVVVGALLLSFGLADRLRELTAERERLIPELETRNAELERLSYALSHDLRNPLHTILNFVGAIEHDAQAGETARLRGDLTTIRIAATQLRGYLDDLLELTRRSLPRGRVERVELAELVVESQQFLDDEITARGATIEVGQLPAVRGDRSRLSEVMTVLIENALLHGGRESPRIEIEAHRKEDETVIWIRDNGVGVTPRYQQRIFDLFEKLDPNSPGRGMGLALARRIVEAHGGRIWCETPGDGEGISFVWTLPR